MTTRSFVFVSMLAWALAAHACDDVSPLDYHAPPRDAAALDRFDPVQVAACRSCTTAPGAVCRGALDRCTAVEPRCGGLLECLTETNCWRQLNLQNFTEPPPCAVDCLKSANVTSINEIGVPTTEFFVCIIDPARCGTVCFDQPADASGDP